MIESCRAPALRTQNAALICNAYAKVHRNDSVVLAHLARELRCALNLSANLVAQRFS